MFSDIWVIENSLKYQSEIEFPTNKQGKITRKIESDRKRWLKTLYFSLEELEVYINEYCKEEKIRKGKSLIQYFKELKHQNGKKVESSEEKELFLHIKNCFEPIPKVIEVYKDEKEEKLKSEKGKGSNVEKVKNYLDALLSLYHFLKPFELSFKNKTEEKQADSFQKDTSFYDSYDEIMGRINGIQSLYNQTRNYLTKKEYSVEKNKTEF